MRSDKKKMIHEYEIPMMKKRQDEEQIPVWCIFTEEIGTVKDSLKGFDWFKKRDPIHRGNTAAYFAEFIETLKNDLTLN